MALLEDVRRIKEDIESIKKILVDDETSELEKEYKEYRKFADARGMKLLGESGLLDDYNEYMSSLEDILFGESAFRSIPKPSEKLEAFKNKFNKYFK